MNLIQFWQVYFIISALTAILYIIGRWYLKQDTRIGDIICVGFGWPVTYVIVITCWVLRLFDFEIKGRK